MCPSDAERGSATAHFDSTVGHSRRPPPWRRSAIGTVLTPLNQPGAAEALDEAIAADPDFAHQQRRAFTRVCFATVQQRAILANRLFRHRHATGDITLLFERS